MFRQSWRLCHDVPGDVPALLDTDRLSSSDTAPSITWSDVTAAAPDTQTWIRRRRMDFPAGSFDLWGLWIALQSVHQDAGVKGHLAHVFETDIRAYPLQASQ